jgi:hypothetical protein
MFGVLLAVAACSAAQGATDRELAHLLVGTWISPGPKGNPLGDYVISETFMPSGKATAAGHWGGPCGVEFMAKTWRWSVSQGNLVTVNDQGAVVKDHILSIDGREFVFLSALNHVVERRTRSTTQCPVS